MSDGWCSNCGRKSSTIISALQRLPEDTLLIMRIRWFQDSGFKRLGFKRLGFKRLGFKIQSSGAAGFKFQDSGQRGCWFQVSRDLVASFKIQVSRDLVSSFKIQSSGAAGFRFQDSGFRVDKTWNLNRAKPYETWNRPYPSGFRCFKPVIGLPLREVMKSFLLLWHITTPTVA